VKRRPRGQAHRGQGRDGIEIRIAHRDADREWRGLGHRRRKRGAVTTGMRSTFVTVTWVLAVSASAFEAKNVML
jgi:hypothetical protein